MKKYIIGSSIVAGILVLMISLVAFTQEKTFVKVKETESAIDCSNVKTDPILRIQSELTNYYFSIDVCPEVRVMYTKKYNRDELSEDKLQEIDPEGLYNEFTFYKEAETVEEMKEAFEQAAEMLENNLYPLTP